MSIATTLTARQLYTGKEWLQNYTFKKGGGEILANGEATGQSVSIDLLIPSFIDIQLYGAEGLLFSAYPSVASIAAIQSHCKKAGTTHFLPTMATNSFEVFLQGINAVRSYWEQGGEGCLGLHLEGPWINPAKKGAHDASYIAIPSVQDVQAIIDAGKGVVKMVTLAPELCSNEVIELLVRHDILISAGHSNATFKEALQGFDNGIKLVTHLFNAMSPLLHRAPGLVGATFHHSAVMASIIPDGYHVDWSVLSITHRCMGNRLFVITDAVTDCQIGPYRHSLNNDHYVANGVLSGSALTMLQAFNNLIKKGNFSVQDATQLCSMNPAAAIGLCREKQLLDIGNPSCYIALNKTDQGYILMDIL